MMVLKTSIVASTNPEPSLNDMNRIKNSVRLIAIASVNGQCTPPEVKMTSQ